MRLAGRRFQFLALCLLMCVPLGAAGCSHVIYRPSKAAESAGAVSAPVPKGGEVQFTSSDGVRLDGLFLAAKTEHPKGVVIHFHGNSENLYSFVKSFDWMPVQGFDVFLFDYRGYGKSEGSPSQEGLNRDARAAIEYVMHRVPSQHRRDLILYGQSLGSAVLLRALRDVPDKSRILSVIVEGGFVSYREISRDFVGRHWYTWPFQPMASLLISDEFNARDDVGKVSPLPLLVMHSEGDPIVPLRFGLDLYDRAAGPKLLWKIPGRGHIDAMTNHGALYRGRLLAYLDGLRGD